MWMFPIGINTGNAELLLEVADKLMGEVIDELQEAEKKKWWGGLLLISAVVLLLVAIRL